jgi:DinB superfamily
VPTRTPLVPLITLLVLASLPAASQNAARTTAEAIRGHFASINQHILTMAKDFPEDKYEFKLKPEMRSFREVLVHVAGGNVYAAKAGRGEKVAWDDLDPKNYPDKAAVVAMLEKTITDADTTLKSVPDAALAKSVEPWISVIEHSAEHYGLLIAYYRANGLVPPQSRPK